MKILLVDDHAIVRHGVKRLLERRADWTVCGEAGSRREALALARRTKPDLVITGLNLADCDGLELVSELSTERPDLRILVLSVRDEVLFAERAIQAGAHGYVQKTAPAETLLDAIRTVLDGNIYVGDAVRGRILRRISEGGPPAASSSVEKLTERELQVFRLLGLGRSTRQVAEALHLSVKTIETHRAKIMRKLDLDDAAQLLHRAVEWVLRKSRGPSDPEGKGGPSS